MTIPIELVDHILSFLRPDKTLEICSTVFPQLADKHLYSHIILCSGRCGYVEEFYWPKFLDFIYQVNQRPNILLFVKNIQIIIFTVPAPNFLPIISKLLPKFSKLRSIDLQGWGPFSWDDLKPDFSTAFQKCLRFPLINKVSISNIDYFPLDLFDNCHNLKKLCLGGHFTGVCTSSYPPLSSLRIDIPLHTIESPTYLPKIVSWMNSRTLQSLSLCIDQSIDLQPLIEACSPTLLTLDLDISYDGEYRSILFKTQLLIGFAS